MDEQMMSASMANPEPSPESYPEPSDPTYATDPTEPTEPTEFSDYDAPPMSNGQPSEIALDDDGEVKFSEDFFDTPDNQREPERPRMYTHEELQNTPFEKWQKDRVPEELREYYDIVSSQLQGRYAQQQIQQRPTNPPMFEAPRNYTPKELSEEAQRMAVQRLGLEDPDDFDDYEPEHRAALNMAMNELIQQNYAARQNYERVSREYQNLQQFNAQIAARPDYKEFDAWFGGKLKEMKVSPQALDAYLTNYARQSGGNYAAIQNAIAGWYNEFLQEKGRPMSSSARTPRPPMMESTLGQPYDVVRGVNMRDFGDMDSEAQAAALMRMGYV